MAGFVAQGVYVAMLTPFTRGGAQVDYEAAGALAASLVKRGASGLFVCGSTGEAPLMTLEERKRTLETVLGAAGKKATIIAHTGCFDTASAIELTRHAAEAGAHAAAAVAPGYFRYDDESLAQHYLALAKAVPSFPNLLYNIPQLVQNALSIPLILRLANEAENIVGIKDSSENMVHLTHLINVAPKGFNVINGCDNYGAQAFMAGANAAVSGTANITVELYEEIARLARKGELRKAMEKQLKLEEACRALRYGGRYAAFKESMRILGLADPGFVRPPQRELSAKEKRELAANWEKIGWK